MNKSITKKVFLSKYFTGNIVLVANMCEVCYKNCLDVKIVGVNSNFLKRTNKNTKRKKTINIKVGGMDGNNNGRICDYNFGKFDQMEAHFVQSQPKMLCPTVKVDIPKFVPLKSPYNLIEESLYHDPWGLLVATIFLNKTKCHVAKPHLEKFLKDFKNPLQVLKSTPKDFEVYFTQSGLKYKKSIQIWRMSYDFVFKKWKTVKDLYGIGQYGEDAFKMFILGDFTVEPEDRFLKIYKNWYQKINKEQF